MAIEGTMAGTDTTVIQGDERFAKLANAVSDAIAAAVLAGMEADEASCVAVQVAADYGRACYGNVYLAALAGVVMKREAFPLPTDFTK